MSAPEPVDPHAALELCAKSRGVLAMFGQAYTGSPEHVAELLTHVEAFARVAIHLRDYAARARKGSGHGQVESDLADEVLRVFGGAREWRCDQCGEDVVGVRGHVCGKGG